MAQDSLPDCSCHNCINQPEMGFANPGLRLVACCPVCHNKRCPKGTCHLHACTESNEPGQLGSRYGIPDETCDLCVQKQKEATVTRKESPLARQMVPPQKKDTP